MGCNFEQKSNISTSLQEFGKFTVDIYFLFIYNYLRNSLTQRTINLIIKVKFNIFSINKK